MSRLSGRHAIVTGAARGIGKGIAERFAREGAKVTLADTNAEAGEAVADEIAKAGGEALFVTCDVGDKASVEALIADAVETHGDLDIMVSNAGIIAAGDFLELAEEDFDKVIRVNLKGVFLTGQAAARQMVKQGHGGAIVNMSSINSVVAIPNQAPYVTAKGGVQQLTKVMGLALIPHGIRVNAIGPGTIATEMAATIMTDETARRTIMSRTPIGRLGEVDEIASVAVFLASDDASYMVGETVMADGGRLALNYTVPVAD
jgi:NAD(P)-dependent dehydrogenase (short-subunit alcohol dehydrogenase family)